MVSLAALAILTCFLFLPALGSDAVFYFRDVSQNHHPYRQLTVSMLAAGEAPLWNPLRGAGQPLLANPNALVLHPTTLLFLALPFEAAFKLSIIGQIFLAAAGTWLLLRDAGAGRTAALLGAGVFAFSGYMVSLGNLINILDSAAWMPLTLCMAGRAMTRRFAPWGSLAALSLAVQLLSGEPAVLICTALALLALHFSFDAGAAGAPARSTAARISAIAGVALLAAALAMVGLLPGVELLARSERGAGFADIDVMKWSMSPVSLLETAVPRLFGDPTRTGLSTYWGGGVFDGGLPFILSLYLGPGALILAGIGLSGAWRAGSRRRAEALALGGLALLGVALALGRYAPLYPLLVQMVSPLQSVRYPVKYFLLASWAASLLAARGYDALAAVSAASSREGWRPQRREGRMLAVGGLIAGAGVATYLIGIPEAMLQAWLSLPRGSASAQDLSRIGASIDGKLIAAGLLAGAAVILAALARRRFLVPSLLALSILPLLANGAGLNGVGSRDVYAKTPILTGLLQRDGAGGRLWAEPRPKGFAFRTPEGPRSDSLYWGFLWDRMTLRNATYFDQDARFAYDRGNEKLDVMPGAALGKLLYESIEAGSSLTPAQESRLLSVAAVDRIITYGTLALPGFEETARLEGESNVPVVILRNTGALPRAYVACRIEVIPDLGTALVRLRDPSFDPFRSVILEDGHAPAGPPASTSDPIPARVVEERGSRVVVRATTPAAGYLVLADTFYPGWIAKVDGVEAAIVRANAMFRAVAIPAGAHEVEFVYRPESVRSGLLVSAAALLLAGFLAVPRRR